MRNREKWCINQTGYEAGGFEIVLVVTEAWPFYVFNFGVSGQVANQLQRGHDDLK
ncbi:hypothetical protein QWZ16_09300 [Vibrio ostreicida]|uniref:Uncharacterized protein n=2 Tax=Vibrio ostreicida TaxID=526588 RepID=A0ABT8BUX8_9VIBR|nr:hypothetical protein [Vibrio ostreicida]MDN3609893.1 hypothetical protein [Vibrio ostreicida]